MNKKDIQDAASAASAAAGNAELDRMLISTKVVAGVHRDMDMLPLVSIGPSGIGGRYQTEFYGYPPGMTDLELRADMECRWCGAVLTSDEDTCECW